MQLYKGRPADVSGRSEKEIKVYDFLDSLGIEYYRIDHEPAGYSIDPEYFYALEAALGASICNNMFLANRQRTVFHMMMVDGIKRFHSGDVSKQVLVDEELLGKEFLGCHPCVNTTSLRFRTEDIFGKFLKATGHDYITIRIE